MNNYISANLRRIFRKQSFLWAFRAFAGCFAIHVFTYFDPNFIAGMYFPQMTEFIDYFPLVVELLTFLSVYADNFKCRSMQIVIGYGMPRGRSSLQDWRICLHLTGRKIAKRKGFLS